MNSATGLEPVTLNPATAAKNLRTPLPSSLHPAVRAWMDAITLPTYLPAAPDTNPMFLEKRVYQGSNGKVYPLPFTARIAEQPVDRKWKGDVEIFDLTGHPKAKRAYGWSHPDGDDNKTERFVATLEIPPVTSPETAVKTAIYSDIKQGTIQVAK